jgi:hypothetical protein
MSAPFHSRWLDFVPETARNPTDKTDRRAFVSSVSPTPSRFRDTNPTSSPDSEVPAPSPGFVAPAACPRCGEPTAPLLLVRADGSRAVLCRRGHWTTAHPQGEVT